jgi:hypothetical protein
MRRSPATQRNSRVQADAEAEGSANAAWLTANAPVGAVVLIGGAGLSDFRIRVAQSHLRSDLLPSFWSLVGISTARGLLTVATLPVGDASLVPMTNAVREIKFSELDDVHQYPNVGVVQFADSSDEVLANAKRLMQQRYLLDLPTMLLPWLGYVWGAGTRGNPLHENVGLPAAALVETAFGMAGIELTPGLASGSSCPEAIWQSALWWHDYYEQTAAIDTPKPPLAKATALQGIVPKGIYRVQQYAAAVSYEPPSGRRPAAPPAGPARGARRARKR